MTYRATTDAPTTLQTAAAANADGTTLDISGFSGVIVQLLGPFSATVNFEASLDGDDTDFTPIESINLASGAKSTAPTAAGLYLVLAPGAQRFRARVSGYVSGSVTAKARGLAPGLAAGMNPASSESRTLLASAARTATVDTADETNQSAQGVMVLINVSAVVGVASITVKLQGKDPVSGAYVDLLTSAAITTAGLRRLSLHPALTEAANTKVADILPRTFRVRVEHANADSITYSVAASLAV